MVSSLSIAAMCATLALSALYAIVLCVLVCRGQKGWVRCFLAGMLGCFALFLGPRFWDILHQAERWAGHLLRF